MVLQVLRLRMAAPAEECGVRQHYWSASRQGGREGERVEFDLSLISNSGEDSRLRCKETRGSEMISGVGGRNFLKFSILAVEQITAQARWQVSCSSFTPIRF